jgi:hypothetical protein
VGVLNIIGLVVGPVLAVCCPCRIDDVRPDSFLILARRCIIKAYPTESGSDA